MENGVFPSRLVARAPGHTPNPRETRSPKIPRNCLRGFFLQHKAPMAQRSGEPLLHIEITEVREVTNYSPAIEIAFESLRSLGDRCEYHQPVRPGWPSAAVSAAAKLSLRTSRPPVPGRCDTRYRGCSRQTRALHCSLTSRCLHMPRRTGQNRPPPAASLHARIECRFWWL